MKLKLVIVDLQISRRAKRIGLAGVASLAVLGAAAMGSASVPRTWSDGEILTASDLNANFTALDDRLTTLEDSATMMPTGTIVAYGGTTTPPGWTLCDGKELIRASEGALFAAIGTLHGAGDGVSTFNVPDLRGRFLRGADHASGHDPDAATRIAAAAGGATGDMVGSLQEHQTGPHNHTGTTGPEQLPGGAVGMWYDHPGQYRFTSSGGTGIAQNLQHTHSFTTNLSDGSESRPVNLSVNYIIKL